MWERKVKVASWNGLPFNIQQTTLDTGKRLHVVELPYADEPYIKVMGAKAKGVNLEAVFVGANSLVDANAFVAELENSPLGTLEHPYLGELSLVYQSASQSFNTKKGLVTLSLKFLRQGQEIVLTRTADDKSISKLCGNVVDNSAIKFAEDIEQASTEDISAIQRDFYSALNAVKYFANRILSVNSNLPSLYNQIQDGISAVNLIANAPGTFTDFFTAIINDLVSTISSGSLLSANQSTTSLLSDAITSDSVSIHSNIQMTVAIVLLSDSIALLETDDELSFDSFSCTSDDEGSCLLIDDVYREINTISALLEARISEATQVADYESLALVDSLNALHNAVIKQKGKVETLLLSAKNIEVVVPRPLLCIAQSQTCSADELSVLNTIAHPLFASGMLRVPNE